MQHHLVDNGHQRANANFQCLFGRGVAQIHQGRREMAGLVRRLAEEVTNKFCRVIRRHIRSHKKSAVLSKQL